MCSPQVAGEQCGALPWGSGARSLSLVILPGHPLPCSPSGLAVHMGASGLQVTFLLGVCPMASVFSLSEGMILEVDYLTFEPIDHCCSCGHIISELIY